MNQPIHIAINRTVKPGREDDFEKAILTFFADAQENETTLGAQLLRPLPGSDSRTYGIMRSFKSEHDRDQFYASERFKKMGASSGTTRGKRLFAQGTERIGGFFHRSFTHDAATLVEDGRSHLAGRLADRVCCNVSGRSLAAFRLAVLVSRGHRNIGRRGHFDLGGNAVADKLV
jgi:heme-degrading monooxygenase HmoA